MRIPPYIATEARMLASFSHITVSVRLSTSHRSVHLDVSLIWNPFQWKLFQYYAHEDKYMSGVHIRALCLAGDLSTFNH